MKNAILITAYKKVDRLQKLIEALNSDDSFTFYIHVDKKCGISNFDMDRLRGLGQVRLVEKKYNINWGSFNHLKAFLYLASEAIKDPCLDYLHTVTGQDFPIKSCKQINSFLEKNNGKEFIDNSVFPVNGWPGGGLDRIVYHNLYDRLNPFSVLQGWTIRLLIGMQKLLQLKRKLPLDKSKLYGGSTYWTLTRNCVSYIFDHVKANPEFLHMFENSFCAEEIFFQTIIMNSPFKNQVINNNLRYINWEYRNSSMPAVLDDTDFESIKKSEAFFARKFDTPASDHLLKKISELIR